MPNDPPPVRVTTSFIQAIKNSTYESGHCVLAGVTLYPYVTTANEWAMGTSPTVPELGLSQAHAALLHHASAQVVDGGYFESQGTRYELRLSAAAAYAAQA